MKNPLKITTRNQFVFCIDIFRIFVIFGRFGGPKVGSKFWFFFSGFFHIGLIWAPVAPQGVPKSPPGSNLGDILVDFNDFYVHFWGRILFS